MKCSDKTNETKSKTSQLLTSKQTAEKLGITLRALYLKVYRNQIPYIKFGTNNSSLRFDEDEIQSWIDSHRKGV